MQWGLQTRSTVLPAKLAEPVFSPRHVLKSDLTEKLLGTVPQLYQSPCTCRCSLISHTCASLRSPLTQLSHVVLFIWLFCICRGFRKNRRHHRRISYCCTHDLRRHLKVRWRASDPKKMETAVKCARFNSFRLSSLFHSCLSALPTRCSVRHSSGVLTPS